MPLPADLRRRLRVLAFLAAALIVWQALASSGFWPSYIFPSPGGVLSSFASGVMDGTFPRGLYASLSRMLVGYSISAFLGITLGLLLSRFQLLQDTLGSLALGLQALPSIAWLPLAILWFGLNDSAIIFIVVMGALLSITIATDSGIRSIPPIYLKAAQNMGARGLRRYTDVILPAALPGIVAGMKQGWGFAWRSLMAGELIFITLGPGQLLAMGRELNDINRVVAVMLLIMLVGMLVDRLAFGRAEDAIRRKWGLKQEA